MKSKKFLFYSFLCCIGFLQAPDGDTTPLFNDEPVNLSGHDHDGDGEYVTLDEINPVRKLPARSSLSSVSDSTSSSGSHKGSIDSGSRGTTTPLPVDTSSSSLWDILTGKKRKEANQDVDDSLGWIDPITTKKLNYLKKTPVKKLTEDQRTDKAMELFFELKEQFLDISKKAEKFKFTTFTSAQQQEVQKLAEGAIESLENAFTEWANSHRNVADLKKLEKAFARIKKDYNYQLKLIRKTKVVTKAERQNEAALEAAQEAWEWAGSLFDPIQRKYNATKDETLVNNTTLGRDLIQQARVKTSPDLTQEQNSRLVLNQTRMAMLYEAELAFKAAYKKPLFSFARYVEKQVNTYKPQVLVLGKELGLKDAQSKPIDIISYLKDNPTQTWATLLPRDTVLERYFEQKKALMQERTAFADIHVLESGDETTPFRQRQKPEYKQLTEQIDALSRKIDEREVLLQDAVAYVKEAGQNASVEGFVKSYKEKMNTFYNELLKGFKKKK